MIRLMTCIAVAMCYAFSIKMRFQTGIFDPAMVFFSAFPMVAGILLGFRAGVAFLFVTFGCYAFFFFGRDFFPLPEFLLNQDALALRTAVTLAIFAAVSALATLFFILSSERAYARVLEAKRQLEEYKNSLEQMVEDRTATINTQALELQEALRLEKEMSDLQDQWVSAVSHELRTPLTVIDGQARRLVKQSATITPEDMEEKASKIRENVQRLTQLMERTLQTSKRAKSDIQLTLSPVDIRAKLEAIIQVQMELNPDHSISVDLTDLPRTIKGDEAFIDHMLSNVVSNAVKYSRSNPKVEIQARADDTRIEIEVLDHGVGIPKDEIDKIASRFYRARTSKGIQGTGIGLSLARKIAEDHSGRLAIESEEGQWTKVSVRLPIDGPTNDSPEAAKAA